MLVPVTRPGNWHEAWIALCITACASVASFCIALKLPLIDAKLGILSKPTLAQRLDAMDKVLLTPLMAVLGALAVWASLELGGDVLSRWHGSTWASRWCSLIYSAKMVLDVPTQLYSLQDQPGKMRQMMVHHVLSCVAIGCGYGTGRMQYFGCLAVCSEVTTVFLNLIFAIKLFGGNATPHQKLATKVSGVSLWAAYIVFRLSLFPFWLWRFHTDSRAAPDLTVALTSTFERTFYPAVVTLLLALSSVWFVAITKATVKGLKPQNPAASKRLS